MYTRDYYVNDLSARTVKHDEEHQHRQLEVGEQQDRRYQQCLLVGPYFGDGSAAETVARLLQDGGGGMHSEQGHRARILSY